MEFKKLMSEIGETIDYLEKHYKYYNEYVENKYLHNDFVDLLECLRKWDTNQAIELVKKLCDKENF